jgi:hypothetical protein
MKFAAPDHIAVEAAGFSRFIGRDGDSGAYREVDQTRAGLTPAFYRRTQSWIRGSTLG